MVETRESTEAGKVINFKPEEMEMLSVSSFQPPCSSSSFPLIPISHSVTTSFPLTPNKPHKIASSSSVSLLSNARSNDQFPQVRNGFSVSAGKKKKKKGGSGGDSLIELEGFDDDEEGDDDAEGFYLPFGGMKEWFEKKPSGFGVGKEYDTTVEEKLLEEIEQSRKAQLANINKLKNSPPIASSKKELIKEPEVVPKGIRVRVRNLPKKRNIHRDLQSAFKGFPAIVSISPAVSGNKKTRDPICKGFAFVYLGSEAAARSFVQTYSKKSITFGKAQKMITCEISKPPSSSDSATEDLANVTRTVIPKHRHHNAEVKAVVDSSIDDVSFESQEEDAAVIDSSIDKASSESWEEDEAESWEEDDIIIESALDEISSESWEGSTPDESIGMDDQYISASWEEASSEEIKLNGDEIVMPKIVDKIDYASPKHKMTPATKKKPKVKGKPEKAPKSNIPGSTKRLKVKDKAVLADVFSKYGANASLALKK